VNVGDYFVKAKKNTIVIGPKDVGIKGLEIHWTAYADRNGFGLDHVSIKWKGRAIYRKNTWYDTR